MADPGTADSRAFALAHEGATLLERYRKLGDTASLDLAERHLREAVGRDPAFSFALFTHAVATEYLGNHAVAIEEFSRLRRQQPTYHPDDVTYNLATSYLTSYTEDGYDRAHELFLSLAKTSKRPAMQALAYASLANVAAHRLADAVRASNADGVANHGRETDRYANDTERLVASIPPADPQGSRRSTRVWSNFSKSFHPASLGFVALALSRFHRSTNSRSRSCTMSPSSLV